MAAQIYINGGLLDFMGEVFDDFMTKTVQPQLSRGGLIYSKIEARTATIEVTDVKVAPQDYDQLIEFLNGCEACFDGFALTLVMDDSCDPALAGRWDFFGVRIASQPRLSFFGQEISSLTFAYERRQRAEGSTTNGAATSSPLTGGFATPT